MVGKYGRHWREVYSMKWNVWKWIARIPPGAAIIACLVLLPAAAWFTLQLRFSYDYADFFPDRDPDLEFYQDFRERFEPDDNFLLIGMQPEGGVFEQGFLRALDSATRAAGQLPGVDRSLSVSNFRYAVVSPFGILDYPAVHPEDTSRFTADSVRIFQDERLRGKLISEDGRTAVILLKTADTLDQQDAQPLVTGVRRIMESTGLREFHLLGKAYFETELIRIQRNEFLLYACLSVLLVCVITFLMFRKVWVVVLSALTVGISLLLFTGLLGALGIEQNVMSTLYPIVIIIIGISDAVHFIGKYLVELRRNSHRRIALFRTLSDIGFATFLTAVTSAIGFLTMLTSNVPPIRNFGLYSALGVLVVYAVVVLLISPILTLFRPEQIDAHTDGESPRWTYFLQRINAIGKNRPRRVVLITAAVMAVFVYGVTQISTNIHIGQGLPKGARITQDFVFFEKHFNGFRPFEIAAVAQNGHRIDEPAVLRQIEKVEQQAKSYPMVNGIQSITMMYKSMHRAHHGDRVEYYQLPESDSVLSAYNRLLQKFAIREVHTLISEDHKAGRISGFISDVGTDSISMMQEDLRRFIEDETDPDLVHFTATGTGVIFDKNTLYLRQNIISGVLLAFLCIGLVMGYLFRDWKMVMISIIPNIIPLIVCAGIMGLLHIELDAPTSIIFGISYGIAVDDTIHFLSKFNIERQKGYDVEVALQNTFAETGKAVFTMSVILFFGFMILLLSPTAATFNIGLLTGITLFSAIWPDIFLLPILLRKWAKRG